MSGNRADDDYPRDRLTKHRLRDLRQPGYYAKFSTLAQQKFWDAKTREVILKRVNNVPVIRFFSEAEANFLEVICDHVVPQTDRDDAHKIPIVAWIDERLCEDRHDGYRFADMPPDPEAFRLGMKAIEQIAIHSYGHGYIALERLEQDKILKSLHDGAPAAGNEIWERMPVHRFWMMLVQYCIEAYYAHPWSWDEIGFGGPAYPRGYIRLDNGSPEPWEVDEQRYEWDAPNTSVSDLAEPRPSAIEHAAPHPKRGSG